jgi:phospholipid-binding lipoprotein MlaA
MNLRALPALAAVLIVMSWLIGCAGSRPKPTDDIPVAPAPTAADSIAEPPAPPPPPVPEAEPEQPLPAETPAPSQLTEQEERLLEDDTDWTLQPDAQIYTVSDPLEPFNRGVFYLNDKLYFWVMKPVAQGYSVIVRAPARTGIKNFFYNVAAPVRIANNILQGKARAAEAEWARFLYNATIGLLGFGNPAGKHPELNPDEEDMGQTLAAYGLGDGFYLVWPLLGPSTLRDTAGMVGDRFLSPVAFVERWQDSLALSATKEVNNLSFRIGDYEALKKAALDPYESFRNAYIQLRQSKIRQ